MSDQVGGDPPRPEFDRTQQIPAATSSVPPPPNGPGTPPGESEGRRWKTWQMVVAALVSLFIGIGIGASGSEDEGQTDVAADDTTSTTADETTTTEETTTTTEAPTTTTTEAPTTTTTTTTAPPPPPPPPQEVEVASYSGTGTQSMRPFTVGDGWEVQWDFTGDILQIYLNDASGELVGVPANQQGSGSGASYQGQGGTFYIETNAMGDWTIRIVDVP